MLSKEKKYDLIMRALQEEDRPIQAAWRLALAGFHVLPVRCTTEKDEAQQKRPSYPYSSTNTLSKKDGKEAFRDAWSDPRTGVALSPHIGCGILIIDADTPEEVGALGQWWKDTTGEELPTQTVVTPGLQDTNGNWSHKNGGHWYITYSNLDFDGVLDEDLYKKNQNIEYSGSHFNIRLHGSYNVLPPSKRSSGSYKLVGSLIDGTETGVSKALIEACKKPERPDFTPGAIDKTAGFDGEDFTFDDEKPLVDRIATWSSRYANLDTLIGLGFDEDNTSTCSSSCVSLHYARSSHGRSAVLHGGTCSVSAPGTITVFSGTLANDLDIDESTVITVWTVVRQLKYNGDLQACIRGEGIHQELKPIDRHKALKKVERRTTNNAVSYRRTALDEALAAAERKSVRGRLDAIEEMSIRRREKRRLIA